jgi:hypothetical protein
MRRPSARPLARRARHGRSAQQATRQVSQWPGLAVEFAVKSDGLARPPVGAKTR